MYFIISCYGGNMSKPFTINFKVDGDLLALLYICWKYKYPISYFLAFYELYNKTALFVLKALSCNKKIALNDNTFASLIEESRVLHNQIIAGISTNLKIKRLESQVRLGRLIDEDIPEKPTLNYKVFSEDYKEFVKDYLVKNVDNIFSETLTLHIGTKELYQNIK